MNFKEALEHLDVICVRQDTNRILFNFNFKFNEMKIENNKRTLKIDLALKITVALKEDPKELFLTIK